MKEYGEFGEEEMDALKLEASLLHVLHHRNKNQHHLQQFFKQLSILKRTLSRFLEGTGSEYILQKLRTAVIPNCWEEFSRVVARGEFVALGLVLCGSVARIGVILGIEVGEETVVITKTEETETIVQTDELGQVVMREVGTEEIVEVEKFGENDYPVTPSGLTSALEGEDEDVGPDVSEVEVTEKVTSTVRKVADVAGIGDIQPPAKKKRKKRRGNEIDDLFAAFE